MLWWFWVMGTGFLWWICNSLWSRGRIWGVLWWICNSLWSRGGIWGILWWICNSLWSEVGIWCLGSTMGRMDIHGFTLLCSWRMDPQLPEPSPTWCLSLTLHPHFVLWEMGFQTSPKGVCLLLSFTLILHSERWKHSIWAPMIWAFITAIFMAKVTVMRLLCLHVYTCSCQFLLWVLKLTEWITWKCYCRGFSFFFLPATACIYSPVEVQ